MQYCLVIFPSLRFRSSLYQPFPNLMGSNNTEGVLHSFFFLRRLLDYLWDLSRYKLWKKLDSNGLHRWGVIYKLSVPFSCQYKASSARKLPPPADCPVIFLKWLIWVLSRPLGQFSAEAFWAQHLTETSSCSRQCDICLWSCSPVFLTCARSLSGSCDFCLRSHWIPLISEEYEQGKL